MATALLPFLLSDETRNNYGFVVSTAGIDTTQFRRNPVMLWMHTRGQVIGEWVNLRIEDGKLWADARFDVDDPEAARIAGKVERGFLRAVSVQLNFNEEDIAIIGGVPVITKCELVEVSFVDIPGNNNCLRLCNESGVILTLDDLNTIKLSRQSLTNLSPNPPQTTMDKKAILLALGLPDSATDEQITTGVLSLKAASTDQVDYKTKYEKLISDQQAEQDRRSLSLVDQAVTDGRLQAGQKDTFLTLFKADFASAEKILAGMQKPVDLVTLARGGAGANGVNGAGAGGQSTEDLATEYDKRDKENTLVSLKRDNPERFKQLYMARWGTPYNV